MFLVGCTRFVGPSMNHTPIRAGAQLRILIPPDYLTVNGLGQASTMEVSENVSVRLSCQAVGSKPAAQLKWYKNSIEVPKGPRRSRRGLRKQDSLYVPRGRSVGRSGQASMSDNLPDNPARFIALDILYPMHFTHLR
ncbi:ig-like domain-containing protein [Trichonephila clavipes]|nr:ig-like domain-containing protein [Trichonephila clavipes]